MSVLHSLDAWPFHLNLLLCACALCALVLFPIIFVGVDQHGPVVGGRSSLLYLCHVLQFLPSELVGVGREPFVLLFGNKLGHFLFDRLLAVEYGTPSVR